MNRIYQGRVSKVELLKEKTKEVERTCSPAERDQLLWDFHELFQDAVNYYSLVFAAMAEALPPKHSMRKLRERIISQWEEFPRPFLGAVSMQKSICHLLDCKSDASFEECVRALKLDAPKEVLAKALDEVVEELEKTNGDIQKTGRGMLPMFVSKKTGATFPREKSAMVRRLGEYRLNTELHDLQSDEEILRFAKEISCLWVANPNKKPVKKKISKGALLCEFVDKLKHSNKVEGLLKSDVSVARFLYGLSRETEQRELVEDDLLEIPNTNKGGDKKAAVAVFRQFPSNETLKILKVFFATKEDLSKEDKRREKADEDFVEAQKKDADYLVCGNDPIEMARGTRGFVCRAFTALPQWQPAGEGIPVWEEFDIAGFKVALTTVNQFAQKTEEREKRKKQAMAELNFMLGEKSTPKSWAKIRKEAGIEVDKEGEGSKTPRILGSDPRYGKLKQLLAEIMEQLDEDPSRDCVFVGSTVAALRCWKELRKGWLLEIKKPEAERDFFAVIGQLQREHRFDFGYEALFSKLAEPEYHEIWMDPTSEAELKIVKNGWARSVLHAAVDARELAEEIERLKDPIRFTPAEPEFSRRLFRFSDLSSGKGVVYPQFGQAETTLAVVRDSVVQKQNVRLHYTAPRLRRDHLDGSPSVESRWMQPLMEAFGLSFPDQPELTKEPALELMPDWVGRKKERRMLLNFSASIDPKGLIDQIAQKTHDSFRWAQWINRQKKWVARHDQFNKFNELLHLYWPGMANEPKSPWWKDPELIGDGFTCLSVDIGQRRAGDWALLETNTVDSDKHFVEIGVTGDTHWHTKLGSMGSFCLPGEGSKVFLNGRLQDEPYGARGRHSKKDEYDQAKDIARCLIHNDHLSELDFYFGEWDEERQRASRTFPENNDELVYLYGRALSRFRTWHRWSWLLKENPSKACAEIEKGRYSKDWEALAAGGDAEQLSEQIEAQFYALREILQETMLQIVHRILPLRGNTWRWVDAGCDAAGKPLHQLLPDGAAPEHTPWIRGQRGLSFARLEQLDHFRRHLLALNRLLRHECGVRPDFGSATRGVSLPDPCESLTQKLNRMKEERVNQTAHLILAQALGVRLRAPCKSAAERRERDVHGEYEVIPGRRPVDFIAIEHLDRYKTDRSRSPRENGRLMKWCHRAIRNKLIEMCEPFGLPVLEVHAAYTSKTDARTGAPGFRTVEVTKEDRNRSPWKHWIKKNTAEAEVIKATFDSLDNAPAGARLLLPRDGGTHFVAMVGKDAPVPKIRQADQNAAVNIGLRAIASPQCLHAHLRVRMEGKGEAYRPKRGNKREKVLFALASDAVFKNWRVNFSDEVKKKPNINLFYDPNHIGTWGVADLSSSSVSDPLTHAGDIWKTVNNGKWKLCQRLNEERVRRNGWAKVDDIPFEF